MTFFVITGARIGIGLEYARQTSGSADNTVLALVRDLTADLSLIKEVQSTSQGKIHIIECDIASDESVSKLAPQVASLLGADGKIDFLINNAAIIQDREETALTLTAESVLSHTNANVMGPARITQSLLEHVAPGAVIANISSGLGSLAKLSDGRIAPGPPSYGISKAALNMLTVLQAHALAGRATVVCVDPGHVKTRAGGPSAVMEVADSARMVLSTLGGLKAEDSGRFLLYSGEDMPW